MMVATKGARGAALVAGMVALLAVPASAQGPSPLPFDVGGAYTLVDQTGRLRTEADPDGHMQLLFFGYANCQEICSAVLPAMAATVDLLEARGLDVTPVMVTIDPRRDTLKTLAPSLAVHHARFVGLTGAQYALDAAYDAFGIETKKLFEDPHYGPVYSHGSFLYLLDAKGVVLTLVPPVLAPEQMADIVAIYAPGAPS